MTSRIAFLAVVLIAGSLCARLAAQAVPPRRPSATETLQAADGQRRSGRLAGDAAGGFRFDGKSPEPSSQLEAGSTVIFEGVGPSPTAGSFPFRVELGGEQRISGRLGVVNASLVRLDECSVSGSVNVVRPGVRAVVQRLGEMQVIEDEFEALNGSRWTLIGDPHTVEEPRIAGERSLRIPAGGTSLTYRVSEPIGSGRLEVAFHDSGAVVAGQQWFVDLLFRGPSGAETVRAILGWREESLSVESPGGPALAVQRLSRKPGWHRLSVRFGTDQTEVSVDGNDLAHGKGPGGPLAEIRLASYNAGKTEPPDDLAGHFDDLRLVRFAEPTVGLEVDASQDEVRLAGGDQVFGQVREADDDRVRLAVDDREALLHWNEVCGLYFRRDSAQGQAIEGLLVRAEWRAAPGNNPRDIDVVDGVLTGLTDSTLTIATPYAGTLQIDRDRMSRLRVLGRGRKIVIDSTAHHLGNEIVAGSTPLDPPEPEGGVLERSFELATIPPGRAFIALDVLQVAGEANGLPFSDRVKKGEIRTNVLVNGTQIDYLNHYISSKNESPERIRLPIPAGLLHAGKNRVRFEQVGEADDPKQFDDIGVLEIAVEFDTERHAATSSEKP